jgi:hypothetical protein
MVSDLLRSSSRLLTPACFVALLAGGTAFAEDRPAPRLVPAADSSAPASVQPAGDLKASAAPAMVDTSSAGLRVGMGISGGMAAALGTLSVLGMQQQATGYGAQPGSLAGQVAVVVSGLWLAVPTAVWGAELLVGSEASFVDVLFGNALGTLPGLVLTVAGLLASAPAYALGLMALPVGAIIGSVVAASRSHDAKFKKHVAPVLGFAPMRGGGAVMLGLTF